MSSTRSPDAGIVVGLEPVGAEMRSKQRADLGGDPRRHVHAVGDRSHGQRLERHAGQIDCHICFVTSPCSWLTPLTAPLVRSASAVMLNIGRLPLS
jgi:hypothetical protein